jgi:nucleotide-binding universal stress UspA family protein
VVLDGLCYSRKDQVETSVLFEAPAARSLIGFPPMKEIMAGCATQPKCRRERRRSRVKKLLLATDLTPRGDRAFDRAVQLATAAGAGLTLMYVVDDQWVPGPYVSQMLDEARKALRAEIDEAGLPSDLPVDVAVASGQAYKALVGKAGEGAYDMLIVGSPHGDRVSELMLGTTVDRVARFSPCPVLLVRRRPRHPYRNVLVATDLSMPSRYALEKALQLFPEAQLSVIHATSGRAGSTADDSQLVRDMVTACVTQQAGLVTRLLDDIRILIRQGGPADAIREEVRQTGVDLVVAGTRGRTAAANVLLGSVAKVLMEVLPCDVLAVRG